MIRKSCHVPQHGWNLRTLCSISLMIREMPIKTTMRYYLTPVRRISIKKSTNNKSWRGCGEKGTLLGCWKEGKVVQSPWRRVWGFSKKLKAAIIWPSNPTFGRISGENHDSKGYVQPRVHCSAVYRSRDMRTSELSVSRWMDEDAVRVCSSGALSHSTERNNAIWSNMDGPGDDHTKWSEPDRDKYHMISLICGILKKHGTDELIYKIETDSQTEIMNLQLPKGNGVGRDKLKDWDQNIHTSVYKVN